MNRNDNFFLVRFLAKAGFGRHRTPPLHRPFVSSCFKNRTQSPVSHLHSAKVLDGFGDVRGSPGPMPAPHTHLTREVRAQQRNGSVLRLLQQEQGNLFLPELGAPLSFRRPLVKLLACVGFS